MLRTPYFAANSWFASTSTFPTTALPSYSLLISSMIGPTILHGPHQAAQKSTITGMLLFNTVSSNVASVISNAIIYNLMCSTSYYYTILVKNFAKAYKSEEHTSELQSRENLVCRLLLEKKNNSTAMSPGA